MKTQNAAAGTIRSALRHTAFRRLVAGQAVSQLGDWLYNLALVAVVVERTHSMAWAGVTTAARVIPLVALGPVGGVIADRFDRRHVMIACDLVRLVLMVLLSLVSVAHLPVALAPLIAAAATAAAAPFLPAVSAVTPSLVPDADLPGANAARSAVTGVGIFLGPAFSGILLLLGSPAVAFALNAVTFGISALAVLAIPGSGAFRPAGTDKRSGGLLRDVATGAAVLRSQPQARRLIGADVVVSLLYGMQTVLLLTVATRAGFGMDGYGYLFAAIGAGGLVGTALASSALRCPHPHAVLVAALAATGLPMPLLMIVKWPAAVLALAAANGVGAILVDILTETGLQRTLGPEVFGRAYGLALPAILGGIVVGSLVAAPLMSILGDSGAIAAAGGIVLAYAAAMLRRSRPMPVKARASAAAGTGGLTPAGASRSLTQSP